MEKFLVLIVVLLFIYNLLKPNKKKQGKNMVNNIQDLQKKLSNIEQHNKATNKTQKEVQKKNTVTNQQESTISYEKTEMTVKTYDDEISLAEYLETKKRTKGFENLDKSELYADDNTKKVDTDISFNKENEKWLKQSIKDNAEHTDKHAKKSRFTSKDIKKAYVINQILERKYI